MSRMISVHCASARLIAGVMMCDHPSAVHKLDVIPITVLISPRPPDGSHARLTARTKISMMPCQKFGMLTPTIEAPMMVLDAVFSG